MKKAKKNISRNVKVGTIIQTRDENLFVYFWKKGKIIDKR